MPWQRLQADLFSLSSVAGLGVKRRRWGWKEAAPKAVGHWQQAVSLLVGRSEGSGYLRRALLRSCDAARTWQTALQIVQKAVKTDEPESSLVLWILAWLVPDVRA
eukprot:s875_g1.t1